MAVQNPVTQICGIITIADMKDFSWSHLLQIPIADIKCFVSTLQVSYKINLKNVTDIYFFIISYKILKRNEFLSFTGMNSVFSFLSCPILYIK